MLKKRENKNELRNFNAKVKLVKDGEKWKTELEF